MANSFNYKEKTFHVGDTISLHYKIKEGDKERVQIFKGILLAIKGNSEMTRMITVRKVSRTGIGVERIIALISPYIVDIKLIKKSRYKKAKTYFIRNLSEQEIQRRLYKQKTLK